MKTLLLYILTICFLLQANAQQYKSEIGIGLLRYEDTDIGHDCSNFKPLSVFPITYVNCLIAKSQKTTSLPSIFFRTTLHKNLSLRMSYHFTRVKTEFYQTYAYADQAAFRYRQHDHHNLTTGLQYNLIPHKRLSPYLIAEFAHQIDLANTKHYNEQNQEIPSTSNPSKYEPGLNSGLGLRFNIVPTVSASLESLLVAIGISQYPLSRLSINYNF